MLHIFLITHYYPYIFIFIKKISFYSITYATDNEVLWIWYL